MKDIDWSQPKPRNKFFGALIDNLFGPSATKLELVLGFGFATLAAALVWFYSAYTQLNWTIFQTVVAVYLAFDIGGGIIANATASGKRWWHRPERRSFKNDMYFILPHFYMPLLIMFAFYPGNWIWFASVYGYLIISAIFISKSPLHLQRPVSLFMFALVIMIDLFFFPTAAGLEWFIPLFYLKLLVSHLPFEPPFARKQNK